LISDRCVVALALSRTVSEIRRLIGWESPIFSTPLSFSVFSRGDLFSNL